MALRHTFKALTRHRASTALIVAQIAISCALICNLLFLVGERIAHILRPSGVDEARIVTLQVAGDPGGDAAFAMTRSDLQLLRGIPGVTAVSETNLVPFGSGAFNLALDLKPGQQTPTVSVSAYTGSEQLLEAFGLTILQGRRFTADEFVDFAPFSDSTTGGVPSAVIVSAPLASRLFPGRNPIGQAIYSFDGRPLHIVGVVARMARARDSDDTASYQNAILLPTRLPFTGLSRYVLRVHSQDQRDIVLATAMSKLTANHADRTVIEEASVPLERLRQIYYRQDVASASILMACILALLAVTAFGIIALASFWVRQRQRQIGVRRALGATRTDILREFLSENLLLAGMGIVVGMLLAFWINQWLMQTYELPRLPIAYFASGALLFLLLGQLAVYWPARQATLVPPAEATRSS